jgi:non-ribosomal peptide synthetase component E (peptide arylation enzyme)
VTSPTPTTTATCSSSTGARSSCSSAGFNVYPREVEEVLEAHATSSRPAVIGVPHPQTGEAVKAFVVPRAGASLSPPTCRARANRLARFKAPTIVEIVHELPHSATGKCPSGGCARPPLSHGERLDGERLHGCTTSSR